MDWDVGKVRDVASHWLNESPLPGGERVGVRG